MGVRVVSFRVAGFRVERLKKIAYELKVDVSKILFQAF